MLERQDDTGMTCIQVAENGGNMNVFQCPLLHVLAANPAVKTEEKKEGEWQKTETIVVHLRLLLYYIILRWFTKVIVSQSIWARTLDVLIVYIGYACTVLSITIQTLWYFVGYNS